MTRSEALERYKSEMIKFDTTRNLQWKVNISYWSLLALGIKFFHDGTINLCNCQVWTLAILFFGAHLLFTILIQQSLAFSKSVWIHIGKMVNTDNADVRLDYKEVKRKAKLHGKDLLWIIFQMLGTIIMLLLFLFLYG